MVCVPYAELAEHLGLTLIDFTKSAPDPALAGLIPEGFARRYQAIAVDRSAIQPGDLVFFAADGPGASHVGIATSASTAISATTHGVREHAISDAYWGPRYVGARRVG